MTNENVSQPVQAQSRPQPVIDFGKIFRNYLRHWWWFAISLVVCMGLAFIYIKKKNSVYLVKGLIMVNQEEAGGVGKAGAMTAMMSMLGAGSSDHSNPENEMMKMMSQTNLIDVVNTLNLQYNYWSTSGLLAKKNSLYPHSPIAISIPQHILDTISVGTKFHIVKDKGGKDFTITVEQDGDKLYDAQFTRFPYSARTPYGTFKITLTKYFDPHAELDVYATAASTPATIHLLRENLGVNYLSKKADAIQVDMEDSNIERAEDIINTLMSLYNDRRSRDRIAHNRAALEFIDNRLLTLYNELEVADGKVEQYKRDNRIVDAEAEANYIFTRMSSIDEQYVQMQTRAENYRLFRDMLSNPATNGNQIPFTASELAMSEAFGQFMSGYNTLIDQRMELETTAKAGNAKLDVLDRRIDSTRRTILKVLEREIQNTSTILSKLRQEIAERDARIAGMPAMEHRLFSLMRDKEVKNQIYAFLLQKREETQIALSEDEPVGKIIDKAYPELKPVAPNKLLIMLAAFFFGLFIPIVWLQLRPSDSGKKRREND